MFWKSVFLGFFCFTSIAASSHQEDNIRAKRNPYKNEVTVYRGDTPYYVVPHLEKTIIQRLEYTRLPTFNQTGYTEIHVDEYMKKFLLACKNSTDLLDVGCAFGYWVKKALDINPQLNVILVDPDSKHLSVAWQNLVHENVKNLRAANKGNYSDRPKAIYKGHIYDKKCTFTTHCGAIEYSGLLGNGSADLALMSDVAAYLSPQNLQAGLSNVFDALRPGGKLYLKTPSPYNRFVTGTYLTQMYYYFSAFFKDNPGYMWFYYIISPDYAQSFPKVAHFLSTERTESFAKKSGFEILECSYYKKTDENDYVGLIAQKPLRKIKNIQSQNEAPEVFISLPGDSLSGLLELKNLARQIKWLGTFF